MSGSGSTERDDEALAAEYVIGVLPHAERLAFTKRLENEPELRAKVRLWDEHMFELSPEFAPVTPPLNILDKIEAELFVQPHTSSRAWGSLVFLRTLAIASLAAVAVLAGLLTWTMQQQLQPTPDRTYLADLSGEDGSVKMLAVFNTSQGKLNFKIISGAPAMNRDFEVWFIDGSKPPVSLGVLPLAGKQALSVSEKLLSSLATAVLAISDEPKGGSPTGSPTGKVLAVGKVIAL